MTEIKIERAKIIYPALYKGRGFMNDGKLRYTTGFEYAGPELKEAGVHPREKDGLYASNSRFPPIVNGMEGDYARLRIALETAEQRNLGRDFLFRDLYVNMVLDVFEYDNTYGQGFCASLLSVTVGEKELYDRAFKHYDRIGEKP